jgi:hypothetical protein
MQQFSALSARWINNPGLIDIDSRQFHRKSEPKQRCRMRKSREIDGKLSEDAVGEIVFECFVRFHDFLEGF